MIHYLYFIYLWMSIWCYIKTINFISVKYIGKSFASLALASSFWHGSETRNGQAADRRINDLFAYVTYQEVAKTLKGNISVLFDLNYEPRYSYNLILFAKNWSMYILFLKILFNSFQQILVQGAIWTRNYRFVYEHVHWNSRSGLGTHLKWYRFSWPSDNYVWLFQPCPYNDIWRNICWHTYRNPCQCFFVRIMCYYT